ncbi:MAG: efflux transporter outer membrane subunit [Methylococcales bacterium]|nr:efflux transporter outer membrane subunit [Methylococcales bacterium]
MKNIQIHIIVTSLLIDTSFLTGCSHFSEPATQPITPDITYPNHWGISPSHQPSNQTIKKIFENIKLQKLIQEAYQNNQNLKATAKRLNESRISAQIQGVQHRPIITSDTSATKNQDTEQYKLNLNISWEWDIWGKLATQTEAVNAELKARQVDYDAAKFSLKIQITQNWFESIAIAHQIQLAQKNLESFNITQSIIESGYRTGVNPALDVHLTKASVANAKQQLEQQKNALNLKKRQLEVLIGRYPSGTIIIEHHLPKLKNTPDAGIPSTILSQRYDLMVAQHQLKAKLLQWKVTHKNLLPQFNLTGSTGFSSAQLLKLLDPDELLWSLTTQVLQPIFDSGISKAQRDIEQAQYEQAVHQYAHTVLVAFQEVESALTTVQSLRQQIDSLIEAENESKKAEQLAMENYRSGLTDIITLLESQRRRFSSQQAVVNLHNEQLQNRLKLYLALGAAVDNSINATNN